MRTFPVFGVRITLLGTGTSQGVPMVGCGCDVCRSADRRDKRLRSAAMVEVAQGDGRTVRIIIDAGPDFRYQMLRQGVGGIDAIILTHGHKDHTAGIDDVRAFNYFEQRPVDIYCERVVEQIVRKDFDYAFSDQMDYYPGVPDIVLHSIDERPFEICGVPIIPIRAMHYKLPILGFRIGGVCYLTDANSIEQSSIDLMQRCDLLVLNALRHQSHISHFSLGEALGVIERVSPRRAVLTHVSHQMGLWSTLSGQLPQNVELGYDQMEINC